MTESEVRDVLLLRAIETTPDASLDWNDDDRAWASRAAAGVVGTGAGGGRFVAARARLALDRLATRAPAVRLARRIEPWPRRAGWVLPVIAFAAGLIADAIGPSREINVLAPPLLAIMAWNVLVYLSLPVRHLARRGARGARGAVRTILSVVQAITKKRIVRRLPSGDAEAATPGRRQVALAPSLAKFLADWTRASATLTGRRVARTLHLSALAMALGLLAGLYLRGLILEYRAVWESTFLDAAAVHRLLSILLAPASLLSGTALPDPFRLQAMRLPAGSGEPAAAWIHLYAITVALVVIVPRLLLALLERIREHLLVRSFALPLAPSDPWYAAQIRAYTGERTTAVLVPCHSAPAAAHVDRLQQAFDAMSNGAWRLVVTATIGYGSEEEVGPVLASIPDPGAVCVWFSAGATPEAQTHGVLLEHLHDLPAAGTQTVALIDESAFAARFGGTGTASQRRRAERRQAWTRLLDDGGCAFSFIDIERDDAATLAAQMRAAFARVNPAGFPGVRESAAPAGQNSTPAVSA